MDQITMQDPILYEKKTVDNSGKIYVGKKFIGEEVKFALRPVSDEDEELDDVVDEDTPDDSTGDND